jgi:alkylated DNA repair dioxygenase AlkB
MASQPSLFADDGRFPEGLAYAPAFLAPSEERDLIARISALPLEPFQFGIYEGKRRVVYFGARYDFTRQRLEPAEDLPDWIMPYVRRTAAFANVDPGSIRHALFTEYDVGAGIGWHRDKQQFDEVFALSLGSACGIRFRRKRSSKWDRFTLDCAPRSLYAMRGPARSVWQHSIAPVREKRYSITFRTMHDSSVAPL